MTGFCACHFLTSILQFSGLRVCFHAISQKRRDERKVGDNNQKPHDIK